MARKSGDLALLGVGDAREMWVLVWVWVWVRMRALPVGYGYGALHGMVWYGGEE
jgi:hypothetical protein